MAKKNTMSTLAAGAVARVKGQAGFTGAWGTREHLACMRYMALDALSSATKDKRLGQPVDAQKPDGAKWTIEGLVDAQLKSAYNADPELGYASNFEKLLQACGEVKTAGEYE